MSERVLNLYSGIGGNRKLWENVEVTAVENNEKIAAIYKELFPNDNVVIGDAHQYLLNHYKEFDFIWASPPCPTHSRFNNLFNVKENYRMKYPDMALYQEIIFLKHWHKGNWVVENVKSYYEPLIKPFECDNHYFWSNQYINTLNETEIRGIRTLTNEEKYRNRFDLSKFKLNKRFERTVLNNCVLPIVGKYVYDCVQRNKQLTLFDTKPKEGGD